VRRTYAIAVVALLLASSCSHRAESHDGAFRWSIWTTLEIDAPASSVWKVLVDLPAYREWNPFIVEAAGTVATGETLRLRMALPGREPMTIRPRLLAVEPERELRWKGSLWIPGLFDGEHAFVLTALDGRRTRLDHWERFNGILLPIARRMVYDDTVKAFQLLNEALAKRATSD
jgi:hypothetical protein